MTAMRKGLAATRSSADEAIGLEFDLGGRQDTPCLSLRERGTTAARVVQLAHRFNVPLVVDSELVQAVELLELDGEIPPYLYRAVAQLFRRIGKFP